MIVKRTAVETHEGDGVMVKRLMPIPRFHNYDPFVLWDDFTIKPGNGFPDHPHRGFEAITYLFNGSIRHEDNLGNSSTVRGGGAQRFTAGRGIVHSEMPNEKDPTRGIQLWINLPQRLKKVDPAYQQVNHAEFPITEITGGQIKTIVGKDSPLEIMTPMAYLELQLNAGARHKQIITTGMRGLVYMVDGEIEINGETYKRADTAFFDDEGEITISARQKSKLMICYGSAHGEPIFQHGPYVD